MMRESSKRSTAGWFKKLIVSAHGDGPVRRPQTLQSHGAAESTQKLSIVLRDFRGQSVLLARLT